MSINLKPKPTSFKIKFRDLGVPLSHVAKHVGMSYPHFLNVINGVSPMSPRLESLLSKLIGELKEDNKFHCEEVAS